MNMMVNTSELVGNEAEIKRNSETALKSAISKLVASWEKKQATRAKKIGGFGLMAISLAACNSSSDDTATTTTTTTTTPTTTTPAAPTVNNVTIAAATLNNFGKSGENDIFTATGTTLTTNHIIVDSDTTDEDALNVTLTGDYTADPTVIGVETINFTTAATLADGNTELAVDVTNMQASGDTITFDVTSATSLIAALDINNAGTNHYSTSSEFTAVKVTEVLDADIVLTVANTTGITTVTVDGAKGDDLTVNGGTTSDVTIASATTTEDLVVTGKDVVITASDMAGSVTVTAAGKATLTDVDAAVGNITVTAGDDTVITDAVSTTGTITVNAKGAITLADTSATKATGLVLNNTGGTAGDDILIGTGGVAAQAVTSATITSVGAFKADQGIGLDKLQTITVTAAEDSTLEADTPAADQTFNLNADASGITGYTAATEVTYTLEAESGAQTTTMVLGGPTKIVVAGDHAVFEGETITSTNTLGAAISITALNAATDVTKTATDVMIRIGVDMAGNDVSVANGATIEMLDAIAYANANSEIDVAGTATSGGSATVNVKLLNEDGTTGNENINNAGMEFDDANIVNIDAGNGSSWLGTGSITGTMLDTLNISGQGYLNSDSIYETFNIGQNTVTGNATTTTADVVVNASAATGRIVMGLTSAGNATTNVTTGTGADLIDAISQASGDTFTVSLGAGNDVFEVSADDINFNVDGGSGVDTLYLRNNVDLDGSTAAVLTSIERIDVEGTGASQVNASWISGKTFVLGNGGDADDAKLTVIADQVTVDLSGLALYAGTVADVKSDWGANDQTLTDLSALGSLTSTFTGTAGIDEVTGGSGVDNISLGKGADIVTGGVGADVINLGASDGAADQVKFAGDSTDKGDVITSFEVGTGGDTIKMATNKALVKGSAVTGYEAIGAGTTTAKATTAVIVYTGNDLTGTTEADVANLADGDTATISLHGDNQANDVVYIFASDGTNGYLFYAKNTANDDKILADDTIELMATFNGVSDASKVLAANFADFS